MTSRQSLKKNIIYNLSFQILRIILPLATMPYISRIMGAENIGIYSYSYSIATYFGLFILLGLQNYGSRSIAYVRGDRKKTSETFWSIYKMQLLSSFLVLLVYVSYVALFAEFKAMAWIQFIYLLSVALDINWFYFGLEKFDLTVKRNVIIKIICFILVFILVNERDDLIIYAAIVSLGMLMSEIFLWFKLWKYVDYIKVKIEQVYKHVKPNLLLFIPVIAVSIYTMMDKIMIGSLSNMDEVGFYENASKISQVTTIIVSSLGTVMLPRISNLLVKDDRALIKKYLQKSLFIEALIANAFAFGIASVSRELVPVFLGDGFDTCVIVLPILAMSTIFIAWANVIRTQYLIPYRRDKIYVISVILGAAVNLLLNVCLIPQLGSVGAAIGTISAEFVVCCCQTIWVCKKIDVLFYIKQCIPFSIVGLIMFLVLVSIPIPESDAYRLVIKILVGMFIYITLSFIYKKAIMQKIRAMKRD